MSDAASSPPVSPLNTIPSSPTITSRDTLEENVEHMQQHLAGILDVVDNMKRNCTRLQSENRFIQEYIESLMINPRSSESN